MRRSQPWLTNRSRVLRSQHIAAEHALWKRLRNRQLGGFKFVRQEAIGPYFADFVCRDAKLIVEVDGGTHGENVELQADARRAGYLKQHGYKIVRIRNEDVYKNLDRVLDALLFSLSPPAGRGPG